MPNRDYASPNQCSLAQGRAVSNGLAPSQHIVNEGSTGIDQDGAWRFLPAVVDEFATIGRQNRRPLIGWVRQFSPVARCEIGIRRRSQNAASNYQSDQTGGRHEI